jgi:hypothetical protein
MAWIASEVSVRRARRAPAAWMTEARAVARKLGVRSEIEIRESRDEVSPQVAGLFRSVILLPPSASAWSADDRQAALAHEITHIRRGDRRTQALAQAACAIYWFNPLVWYAAASLSRERERACDAAALSLGARPSDYASLLLGLARRGQAGWVSSAALTMARPSAIEGRLLKILGSDVRVPWAASRWIVLASTLAFTGVVLGAKQSTPTASLEAAAAPAQQRIAKDLILQDPPEQSSAITSALVNALGDRNAQVREQAALGLALSSGSAVITPLLDALRDGDAQVREKAAIGLAFRRDSRIVVPLLTAINDSDSQVREKAAIALGASGDERAVDALTKATRDPDAQVREKAVAGLVLLGLRK